MNNRQLNNAIISTIAFYDAVGRFPLTKIELYKYLLKNGEGPAGFSFADFIEYLENNWDELLRYIARYRGFYFLKNNPQGYARRIQTGKTGIKKWRLAQIMAKVIALFPYVEMAGLTGSLALNNTHKKSDIDILIVAKARSIWTTRAFVSLVMHLIGKRRYGTKIADRICLNHYITDDGLSLRPAHLFSAHICATLVPIVDKGNIYHSLISANKDLVALSMQNFLAAPPLLHLKTYRREPNPLPLTPSLLEYILKALQTKRIERGLADTTAGKSTAIFDDHALVFHHPRPKNQEAAYLYQNNLKNLFTDYPHRHT